MVIPDRSPEVRSGGDADRLASPGPPLIATKLRSPIAIAAQLDRPRLHAQLARTLDADVRLTLVSAPPGYGKTIAVAGWLASSHTPHAWLSLDPADNDPVRFLRYLVGALAPLRPGIVIAARSLVGATDPAEIAALLIDALAQADDPLALVLDDYHVISAEPVHAVLRLLVAQGPPFVHLIVLTREDPPFPLPRLRAHRKLAELRAADLRFTDKETAAYLSEGLDLRMDGLHIARLVERTEGWIAGVQLAAISLRNRPDTEALVDAFAGSQRFVLDYLGSETLESLEADLRQFLVRISVAERFTADLCRAVTGRDDSARLLDRAERLNLFLVPLDLERRWYRFHHLFADYLRTLVDDRERRELHERAAVWLERAGLTGEAIDQALQAGSTDHALRLVEAASRATFEVGEFVTLLRWTDALPAERVREIPDLSARVAASLLLIGRLGDAATICAESQARLAEGGRQSGNLGAIHATLRAQLGDPQAAAMARAALGLLEQDDEFRPFALRALGTALLAKGELEASAAMLRTELEVNLAAGRPIPAVLALTQLALALNLTGHRREAETWCRRVLSAYSGARGQVRGGLAYAAYRLGMLLYEANDLAGARYELDRAWEAVGSFGQMRPAIGTAVADLALARLATGDIAGAFDAIGTIRREGTVPLPPRIEDGLAEIEARLHVFAGDAAVASDWADGVQGRVPAGWPGLPAELTLARVRLAQRRSAQAARHLRSARTLAEQAGDVADLVSIGLLEAVLAEQEGRRGAAQLALEGAIRLAAPEGYVRRVVDDGRAIARLLPAVRRIAPAFMDEVLAAVGSDAAGRTVVNRTHGTSPWRDERGDLVEALTARELEVLHLMAAGLGDAAIAEALVVSLTTAKWHAAHVRSKLGARNRTHALVRARELGLV